MGGSTFWLIESEGPHADAVEKCAKKGGKLASLNTQKKIDFVTSELLVNQKDTWIGAKCEDCTNVKDEKWFWPNGEQLFVSEDSEVYRNKMWKEYSGKQTPHDDRFVNVVTRTDMIDVDLCCQPNYLLAFHLTPSSVLKSS